MSVGAVAVSGVGSVPVLLAVRYKRPGTTRKVGPNTHTSAGIAISSLTRQVRHRWCRRPALLPWLSSSPQSGAPEIIPAG
jgi:hypothetical protein